MTTETFFGVKVNSITLNEAIAALEEKQIIFTPNPEILLSAKASKKFTKALKVGTLMFPDGHGLQFVSSLAKFKSKILRALLYFPALVLFLFWKKPFKKVFPELIHGSDFTAVLVSWAELNNKSVYFLGAADGIAKKTAEYFKSQHPNLNIAGFSSGSADETSFIEVRKSGAEVVLVAFGSPKQELWIAKFAKQLPKLHVIIGVGGSFDFWSGSVKRAPKLFRMLGLEWFWRLLQQPLKRSQRIYNALVKFPLTYLFS